MSNKKVIWGKYIWKTIHYVALGYPNNPTENDKDNYKKYFTLFKYVLPCKICKEHYTETLQLHPLSDNILKDKNSLINWTIDLHNIVNEQLGYKKLSYEEALQEIKKDNLCSEKENDYSFYLIILFIIIAIFIYYYKKRKD